MKKAREEKCEEKTKKNTESDNTELTNEEMEELRRIGFIDGVNEEGEVKLKEGVTKKRNWLEMMNSPEQKIKKLEGEVQNLKREALKRARNEEIIKDCILKLDDQNKMFQNKIQEVKEENQKLRKKLEEIKNMIKEINKKNKRKKEGGGKKEGGEVKKREEVKDNTEGENEEEMEIEEEIESEAANIVKKKIKLKEIFIFKFLDRETIEDNFKKIKEKGGEINNMKGIKLKNVFGREEYYIELEYKKRTRVDLEEIRGGELINRRKNNKILEELKKGEIILQI